MKQLLLIVMLVMSVAASAQRPVPRPARHVASRDSVARVARPMPARESAEPMARVDSEAVLADSAALDPHEIIVRDAASRENLFIVISKRDLNLRVYQALKGDTTLVAQFPACLSKNKGNKQRRGDMRTPESPVGKPFRITQIQDASSWRHDFGDGRGSIKAYGHWFLRLATPGHSGIGIHGSTNNESSVPGRASEGCIRLRDQDIITLKERYARVGMPVIIKTEDQGLFPWEESLR